jgi:hypothetical protein
LHHQLTGTLNHSLNEKDTMSRPSATQHPLTLLDWGALTRLIKTGSAAECAPLMRQPRMCILLILAALCITTMLASDLLFAMATYPRPLLLLSGAFLSAVEVIGLGTALFLAIHAKFQAITQGSARHTRVVIPRFVWVTFSYLAMAIIALVIFTCCRCIRPFITGPLLTGIYCGVVASMAMLYAVWLILATIQVIWDIQDGIRYLASRKALRSLTAVCAAMRTVLQTVALMTILVLPNVAVSVFLPAGAANSLLHVLVLVSSIVLVRALGCDPLLRHGIRRSTALLRPCLMVLTSRDSQLTMRSGRGTVPRQSADGI